MLLFCCLWLAAYVPFFCWWEPWNIEFWLTCLPPLFFLAAVCLDDLASLARAWRWAPVWKLSARGLAAFLACLIFLSNFSGKAAFDAQEENNRFHNMLASVEQVLRPQDLIVVLGNNAVPMYFEYFQPGRRYLSIHNTLKRHREEPSLAFKEIENRLQVELKRRRVYVLNEVMRKESQEQDYLERNFDIEEGEVARFASRFRIKPIKGNTGQVYFYRLAAVGREP
jgi:hypothetical protein